ncbi:MAG: 4-hydroxy-tetrahydrodipicolinate reductase [Actinomycetota bacterium]|nr:4-hydroxy-tetrahydrodipicolinate reductase [Actinomycetota bacterium]
MIRVAVTGACGRMGAVTCAAVEAAEDLSLVARVDPQLGVELADALREQRPDVLVDFSVPAAAATNVRTAVSAGVHAVVGTTGFDLDAIRGLDGANVFVAPNFAIGAVLMMMFAAQAATYMPAAEIIELHHDGKLDAPSGTALLTAQRLQEAVPGRPAPPIHSVRLPGLVAHQAVIFGDVGQTLTIRHDSLGRESFMPGVLLAVRRVQSLPQRLVIGLEQLL